MLMRLYFDGFLCYCDIILDIFTANVTHMCRMKSIISVTETMHLGVCFFFFFFFFYLTANSSSLQKTIRGNKIFSKQLMNIANVTVLSMTDCRNIISTTFLVASRK